MVFWEQRTVAVPYDEICAITDYKDFPDTPLLATNWAHALRSEGFHAHDVRLVREWGPPDDVPLGRRRWDSCDPFADLPRLAECLSESEGNKWGTISGWMLCVTENPCTHACTVGGFEVCVLRSPEGELISLGDQNAKPYFRQIGEVMYTLSLIHI